MKVENKSALYSSVVDIFMHTSEEMVSLVKSVFNRIPVYDIDYRVQPDGSVYDITVEATKNLIKLVKYFKWKKITVVSLAKIDFPFAVYYRKSIEALQGLNICLEMYEIEPHQVNNETGFLKRMAHSDEFSVVVLFGTGKEEEEFLQNIKDWFSKIPFFPIIHGWHNMLNDYIRIHDLDLSGNSYIQERILELDELNLFPSEKYDKLPTHVKYAVGENLYTYEYVMETLVAWKQFDLFDWLTSILSLFRYHIQDKIKRGTTSMTEFFMSKRGFARKIGLMVWGHVFIYEKAFVKSFTSETKNLTFCEIPTCAAGQYRVYGNVSNGFSWNCLSCPENTYKPLSGDGPCEKCTGRFNIDNGKRTACIDPFTNANIDFSNNEFIFLVVLSAFGMIMTLSSLIVFTVKKKTPIVLISDYKISITQMVTICLLNLIILCSFIGKPSLHKCIMRLISISILYVANIGIVFIKSQKLLQAYLSKVKLREEEVKRTKLVQIFTLIIFLISVNAMFALSIYKKQIEINEILDSKIMISFHHCENSFHFNILIASTMVIQLMCSIQAFRGRNLPSVMNDGIVLMYATFILTIVFWSQFCYC